MVPLNGAETHSHRYREWSASSLEHVNIFSISSSQRCSLSLAYVEHQVYLFSTRKRSAFPRRRRKSFSILYRRLSVSSLDTGDFPTPPERWGMSHPYNKEDTFSLPHRWGLSSFVGEEKHSPPFYMGGLPPLRRRNTHVLLPDKESVSSPVRRNISETFRSLHRQWPASSFDREDTFSHRETLSLPIERGSVCYNTI